MSPKKPANGDRPHAMESGAATIRECYGVGVLASICSKSFSDRVEPVDFMAFLAELRSEGCATADPIERMLVEQLAWAHHRLGDLHVQAAKAATIESIAVHNAAAVRLMAEVRKTALALREYRAPAALKGSIVIPQPRLLLFAHSGPVCFSLASARQLLNRGDLKSPAQSHASETARSPNASTIYGEHSMTAVAVTMHCCPTKAWSGPCIRVVRRVNSTWVSLSRPTKNTPGHQLPATWQTCRTGQCAGRTAYPQKSQPPLALHS